MSKGALKWFCKGFNSVFGGVIKNGFKLSLVIYSGIYSHTQGDEKGGLLGV
jgi:hypothetical protein